MGTEASVNIVTGCIKVVDTFRRALMSSGRESCVAVTQRIESWLLFDGNSKMAHSNDFLACLPCRLRAPGSLRITPVDAFQHVAELGLGDRDNTVRGCRPDEASLLEPLCVE